MLEKHVTLDIVLYCFKHFDTVLYFFISFKCCDVGQKAFVTVANTFVYRLFEKKDVLYCLSSLKPGSVSGLGRSEEGLVQFELKCKSFSSNDSIFFDCR